MIEHLGLNKLCLEIGKNTHKDRPNMIRKGAWPWYMCGKKETIVGEEREGQKWIPSIFELAMCVCFSYHSPFL